MTELVGELSQIQEELDSFLTEIREPSIQTPLNLVEESVNLIGKAWGGSWSRYQSRVYYADLQPPPPGMHFSSEWGLTGIFQGSTGDWREYDWDAVSSEVYRRADDADLGPAKGLADKGQDLFQEKRNQLVSILEIVKSRRPDDFIEQLLKNLNEIKVLTAFNFIQAIRPNQLMSRDSLALSQGIQTPPHISVLSEVNEIRSTIYCCSELSKIAVNAASHLERSQSREGNAERVGNNVFIGHGHSPAWKDLKDFIQDRLHLPWDEFNRVPVAGVTNIARLSEMLDSSMFAFIVMTAEDEQPGGQIQARMNVVHEAGLFQGKLGFARAIILLEDKCEEFSNIHGLGQIRFPHGNIKAVFEDVRLVLEREGLLDS